ncbi:MAG: pirin family protein [Sandaracinaceae bacterium]
MSVHILRSEERGHAQHGWLDSRHTFSFAEYYHPERMGFRALRVINEDRVAPGQGFGRHPHRDMEIVSYVLDGELRHADSMGNGTAIRPGDVQRMTAGTGVTHSEMNGSKERAVHFLQIWIVPEQRGLTPGYEQKHFPETERRGRLRLVASRDGREGSITIHQDASIAAGLLAKGERTVHAVAPGRHAWAQVARGEILVGGVRLGPGDAAFTSEAGLLSLEGAGDGLAEVLVFDLA